MVAGLYIARIVSREVCQCITCQLLFVIGCYHVHLKVYWEIFLLLSHICVVAGCVVACSRFVHLSCESNGAFQSIKNWCIFRLAIFSSDCYCAIDALLCVISLAWTPYFWLKLFRLVLKQDTLHLATVMGASCMFLLCSIHNSTSVHISIWLAAYPGQFTYTSLHELI